VMSGDDISTAHNHHHDQDQAGGHHG
jgi:hypothetical protein